MRHRNLTTHEWSRMAIDSLFDRGTLPDWREFAQELRNNEELARNTLFMCEHHQEKASAALAQTLVEHFHPKLLVSDRERHAANTRLREHVVSLGHPTEIDNESIDRDLAREYGSTHDDKK